MSGDGTLSIGRGPGRGAWLCAGSTDCFARAAERGAFERALRREISRAEVQALGQRLAAAR